MREQLEKRLNELKIEYQSGQIMLPSSNPNKPAYGRTCYESVAQSKY